MLTVEVSPEIALALAEDAEDPGPHLKEATFTGVGRMVDGHWVPLNPDTLNPKAQTRRIDQRPMPSGTPWEGPRFRFEVVLGTGRTTWFGGHVLDEQGRCGLCHDRSLPASTYCGSCDCCGRDREIPKAVPKPLDAPPVEDDGRKGGKGSEPEPAKAETRKERRAKMAEERRKAG